MKKIWLYIAFFSLFVFTGSAYATIFPSPLIDTAWLANNKDKVIILEVRKYTKSFTTPAKFAKHKKTGKKLLKSVGGHIPGSILVNYKKVRVNRTIDGQKLKYILPDRAAFEKLIQSHGVNKDSAIVLVSKGQTTKDAMTATRLYWQLKYYGHDNMAILNGGMAQWIEDGHETSTAPGKTSKGDWLATAERKELLATSADVAKAVNDPNTKLIDTRNISQYLGKWKKPFVYSDGHIPGAKLLPAELLTSHKMPIKFTPKKELKMMAAQLGINTSDNTITYCNSGHLASGAWFILHEVMGNKNVKLYDGSMHEWTKAKQPTIAMKVE